MTTMRNQEFDKRWNAAHRDKAQVLQLKAPKIDVTLSLETLLDNYEKQLQNAVKSHAIDSQSCLLVCEKIKELKAAVEPIKEKLQPFMKL